MARTPSNMISLGSSAPNFNLLDVTSNSTLSLFESKGSIGTVIMFICNHCPYVKHVNPTISKLAKDYNSDEIKFIAISSNDVVNYPDDSPEKMKINAIDNDFNFPYLYDEDQSVARAYQAECTPDFFVFDENNQLAYRGRLDEATPGNDKEVNGKDLRAALDALMEGNSISKDQFPSMGCNIKWK